MPRIERGKRRTGRATTSEVAREIAEREAELERQRKAAPDPKKVLRAAHELRAEAQAGKLKRLEQSVDRGRDFVDRAEERRRGAELALAEREAAATERLAEMFAGGQEAASVSDRTAPLRSSLAQAQGEERQARAALGKLESDLAAARQQLIRREHAVAICALEVFARSSGR
jgi:chromosome segregation ATPase